MEQMESGSLLLWKFGFYLFGICYGNSYQSKGSKSIVNISDSNFKHFILSKLHNERLCSIEE